MPPNLFDERLARLLRVAADVFARNGYHATTMRELSRESGMSLAGMYHYVSGKEALLHLIQVRCFGAVLEGAERVLTEVDDPVERVRAFVRHHVAFFTDNMSEMKVLSHEAESLSGVPAEEILVLKRRYARLLQGLIADVGGRHPHVAGYALFGMMNWIYTWYRPDGAMAPPELADTLASLFLDGVRGVPATSQASSET